MTVLRYAAVFLSVIITLFASVIWALMLPASLPAAIALTCIGILGLAIAATVNTLRYKSADRMLSRKTAEHREHYLSAGNGTRAEQRAAQRRANCTLWLCRAYSAALLVCGFLLSLGASGLLIGATAASIQTRELVAVLCVFLSLAVYLLTMYLPMMTLVKVLQEEKTNESEHIVRTQMPLLYELADRAAIVAGYHGRYTLLRIFGPETCFTSKQTREGVAIGVPVAILPLLTKEELVSLLVYSFALAMHRDSDVLRRFDAALMRYDCEHDKLATFKKLFFAYAELRLARTQKKYAAYARVRIERDADKVAAASDPQTWIDACAKCELAANVLRSPCRAVEYEMFAQETPVTDYYERIAAYLDAAIQKDGAHLHPILLRTLWGGDNPRPTLKMRMEQAKVADYDAARREKDAAFVREIAEEMARCSKFAYESFSRDGAWKKLRQEQYLSHNRIIKEYERAQKAGTVDEYLYSQALHAYSMVDDTKVFGVAEHALADTTMRTDAEIMSAVLLCRRDHPAAVDAMLHVIWDNPMLSVNLSLMPILMEAALRTGDQTMVDRAREIRASVSQEILDCTNELSEISVSAESVLPCDLSQARLAQMSAVLLRLCGNAHVYLVKIRAERPVYAVLLEETADKKSVSEYAFSLLSNYCTELTRLEEIYYLYREDSNSAVMQEARKIGIRLT